jgi:hypothetical protein
VHVDAVSVIEPAAPTDRSALLDDPSAGTVRRPDHLRRRGRRFDHDLDKPGGQLGAIGQIQADLKRISIRTTRLSWITEAMTPRMPTTMGIIIRSHAISLSNSLHTKHSYLQDTGFFVNMQTKNKRFDAKGSSSSGNTEALRRGRWRDLAQGIFPERSLP